METSEVSDLVTLDQSWSWVTIIWPFPTHQLMDSTRPEALLQLKRRSISEENFSTHLFIFT